MEVTLSENWYDVIIFFVVDFLALYFSVEKFLFFQSHPAVLVLRSQGIKRLFLNDSFQIAQPLGILNVIVARFTIAFLVL